MGRVCQLFQSRTIDPGMAGIMRQARLLPRTLGAQGQRQASFLGGIFGSGEKKAGIATEATFDYHPYKLHQLDEGPATTTTITRDEALRIYREMVTIRRMETAAANLYKEKAIRGFCHLCSGQEAVYSGMKAAIREQDAIITSYRAHGFTYVMGVPVLGVWPSSLAGSQVVSVEKEAACTCTLRISTVEMGSSEPRYHWGLESPLLRSTM